LAFFLFPDRFPPRPTTRELIRVVENLVYFNVIKVPLLNFVGSGIINPLLECNRQSPDQVIVEQACQDLLDQLNVEGQGEIVKLVYANCLSFYNIAAKEIRQKLFVKEEILNKLKIFEQKFVLQQEDEENRQNESVVQDVLFVAKRFGGFNEDILQKEWQCLNVNFTLEQKVKIINLDFDNAWKTILATKKADGTFKYPTMTKLINAIRSLPHSNADAERTFSMLTDVRTKKRNKLSAIHVQAVCLFKLNLRARGKTAQTMEVDTRPLALMLSLNKTNITKDACLLRLFVDGPSTSSNV